MKILMVSSYLPYPLFSGGHIRLYNLLRELKKNHKITLVCEKREYQSDKDSEEVKKFCDKVIVIPRKKQWSIENIIKTGLSPYPFLMVGHTQPEMKRALEVILKEEKFDLIHVETFYVMQNLPKTEIPVVLVEHNIEYLVYQRFANTTSAFLRLLLQLDILKIKYWEHKFWQKAKVLVSVSREDKGYMGRGDVVVVPNGVDLNNFKFQMSNFKLKNKEKRVLFIGDFRWIQNRDAVAWILKDIWPKMNGKWKMENGKLTLWIVGRDIPDSIKKLTTDENVIFDEDAPEDALKIYHKADVLLAPIRVGGGTGYKILESMASGLPVVTTSLGAQALEAQDGKELVIADDTDGLVCVIEDLLTNEDIYEKIVINARKFIEAQYDWKIIIKKLEEAYKIADAKLNN